MESRSISNYDQNFCEKELFQLINEVNETFWIDAIMKKPFQAECTEN